MHPKKKLVERVAFTLIELLIVVAIIAILAAIAVVNMLEAQTRAKVARVRADLRTVAVALEAYCEATNDYPPNDGGYNVQPIQLSTPIAFLTDTGLKDPFSAHLLHPVHHELAEFYTYQRILSESEYYEVSYAPPSELVDIPGYNPGALLRYGPWRLMSNGPDRIYRDPGLNMAPPTLGGIDIGYDPTNGTVSKGNIHRTQVSPDGLIRR